MTDGHLKVTDGHFYYCLVCVNVQFCWSDYKLQVTLARIANKVYRSVVKIEPGPEA